MRSSRWLQWWPVAVLATISLFIYIANFSYGSYLLGWDVTAPELNISLQFQRILSSVWQEYRGLGTVDTFGHSTNIVHWLYIFLLTQVLPQWLVRYSFIILAHLVGGCGVYVLLQNYVLPKIFKDHDHLKTPALLGGLFYMLNLMTIQMFFLSFEVFIIHFALLPWGVWALLTYLEDGSTKKLLRLLLINVMGLSQSYVPTVFIPYAVIMAMIMIFSLWEMKREKLLRFIIAGLVFFCINASWGLPYLYATTTQSGEIAAARMNVYSTAGIFYRNFAWGDFGSIIKFGGLHLGFYDWYNESRDFQRIMREWYTYYQNPSYTLVAQLFTFIAWLGVLGIFSVALRSKKNFAQLFSLFLIGIFSLFMLGTNIPGIRVVSQFLRDSIPLFFQIFRFTFTKFSLLYAMAASLGFGVTIAVFWMGSRHKFLPQKLIQGILIFIFCNAFIVLSLPVWQGQFFYKQMQVKIPDGYHEMVSYLNSNHTQGRVFGFPIHSFWGWTTNTNTWGYRGSGITWQSIQQPLFDRAFDWNKENETAFNQLNRALYTLDSTTFLELFKKYHTDLILYDNTVFHPGNYPTALFKEETKKFFSELPAITLEKSTDTFELYTVENGNRKLAPFAPSQLTKIDPDYQVAYTTRDQAYADFGDYYQTSEASVEYPFSYLNQEAITNPPASTQNNFVEFTLANPNQKTITIPSLTQNVKAIPLAVFLEKKNESTFEVSWEVQLPTITSANVAITPSIATAAAQIKTKDSIVYVAVENEVFFVPVAQITTRTQVGTTALHNSSFVVNVYAGTPSEVLEPTAALQANCLTHDRTTFDISDNRVCQFSQPLTKSQGKKLAAFITDYKSTHSTRPYICVREPASTNCLADPHYNAISVSNAWETYVSYAQIENSTNLSFEIKEERTKNRETGQIQTSLAKPQLQIFPNLSSTVVDLTGILAQYAVPLQTKDSSITISVPLGSNQAFIHKHDEKETPYTNCSFEQSGEVKKVVSDTGTTFKALHEARLCESILYTALKTDLEYLFAARGESVSGSRLQASLINPQTRRTDLEVFFPDGKFNVGYPIYPSQNKYYSDSKSFLFNLVAESYGPETNETVLNESSFITLPLSWLSKINLEPSDNPTVVSQTTISDQKKIGTFYYSLLLDVQSETGLIVLPQRFDKGWLAYAITDGNYFSGKLLDHHLYNGWGNVWMAPRGNQRLILLFWPQLLNYFGYTLLGIAVIAILGTILKKKP